MKKIFTLALSAMLLGASSVFAQEEDVTSYIANPGFDEDLTFQADGSYKEIVDKETSLSERSWAWIATDSSVYAHPKTTSSQQRKDGLDKELAVNGFIGRIKGWTIETNQTFPKCEWVYFGSVPYALAPQAIPIADDGDTFLGVPEKPAEDSGEENIGAAYLRAGWGGSCVYKQEVKLPCAQYRLDYWIYNFNYEGSKNNTGVKNLCKVTCRKDEFIDEDGFNTQEWTKHSIEFTPTSDFTIQFGFESSGGSGSNPFLFIDGIKLYKIGEADAEQLLASDINDVVDEILEMVQMAPYDQYEGLIEEAADSVEVFRNARGQEEMENALRGLKAYKASIEALAEDIEEYESLYALALMYVESETQYPAYNTFQKAVSKIAAEIMEAGSADFDDYAEQLMEAINDYRMSQVATADNPADYTFLVATPYFTKTWASPIIDFDEEEKIIAVAYPNESEYTAGTAPEDASREGWEIAGTTDGDQRLNYVQGRVCWNAWRQNSSDVAVATTLTDIPNGYYTVSAEMITQADYLSNQHLYASSNLQDAVSPALSAGNWNDDNTGEWEYLTTEKVIVNDGKLTIGALGSAIDGSTNQTGWFCVTNFRLMYYGEATAEEIAAAEKARFASAKDQVNGIHLAGDKAALLDSIAEAEAAKDLEMVNRALDIAKASEDKYDGVIGGSYSDLKEGIANDYSDNAIAIALVPVKEMKDYLASAAATYTEIDAKTAILRYYRDTLIPALQEAEATKDEISSENGKGVIDGTIASVKRNLAQYTDDTDYLAEQVNALNAAISVAQAADIAIVDGADMTSFIVNPTCDNTSNSASPSGWTGQMSDSGNGQYANHGQQYDGSDKYYMDAWNGSAGVLKYKESQVLNVPNGTYVLDAIMRTTGEGFYLYAIADDGTPVMAEAVAPATPMKYIYGAEADEVKTDTYGDLWIQAAEQVMALFNIEGPTESSSIYDLAVDMNGGEETCPAGFDETAWATFAANGGIGRGWFKNTLTVEVKNHKLEIGVATGDAFEGAKPFAGTWLSADNFQLTLSAAGDNTGWDVTTAITNIKTAPAKAGIYNLNGQAVDASYKGIAIKNGKKVLLK